jgi:SAM-dependent methyltransferase
MSHNRPSVTSDNYNTEYYLSNCDGFTCFNEFKGEKLPVRLEYAWRLGDIEAGMTILDIGVGRGETLYQGHKTGANVWGVDFSAASVKIAHSFVSEQRLSGSLAQADAKFIPFQNETFDRVLMLDIVEHLYPWELQKVFQETWRLLKPGGRLVIHTAPNLWYYRVGYPVYRFLERLRGRKLPANPRDRFQFHSTHVNEQSILSLRRNLARCGFEAKTWLDHIPKDGPPPPLVIRLASPVLYNLPPFLWIFRNDIFAVAKK